MSVWIFIEDSFDSAHWLPKVPPSHKCSRMHGHTYRIRLEFEGPINPETGWIVDYSEVKREWDPVKLALDHRVLNEVGLENPTCEALAEFIALLISMPRTGKSLNFPALKRIELRETEHCGVVWEARR